MTTTSFHNKTQCKMFCTYLQSAVKSFYIIHNNYEYFYYNSHSRTQFFASKGFSKTLRRFFTYKLYTLIYIFRISYEHYLCILKHSVKNYPIYCFLWVFETTASQLLTFLCKNERNQMAMLVAIYCRIK